MSCKYYFVGKPSCYILKEVQKKRNQGEIAVAKGDHETNFNDNSREMIFPYIHAIILIMIHKGEVYDIIQEQLLKSVWFV